jgi:hypothetical protein
MDVSDARPILPCGTFVANRDPRLFEKTIRVERRTLMPRILALAFLLGSTMCASSMSGEVAVKSLPMCRAVIADDVAYVAGGIACVSTGIDCVLLQQVSLSESRLSVSHPLIPLALPQHAVSDRKEAVPYCWDFQYGHYWSTAVAVSEQPAILHRSFSLRRIPKTLLGEWSLSDCLADRQPSPTDHAKAMRQITDSDMKLRPLYDYNMLAVVLDKVGSGLSYDLLVADTDSFFVFLSIGNRMTVWYCSYGKVPAGCGTSLLSIDGPPLFKGSRWVQAATFDVPFDCDFRVLCRGARVFFWCSDGRVFEAGGLDQPRPMAILADPVEVTGTDTSFSVTEAVLDRFRGTNELRVSVKQVEDLTGVTMVIRDDDRNNIYWVMPEKVVDNSTPRREVKLDKPGAVPADASGPIVEIYKLMPAIQKLHGGKK